MKTKRKAGITLIKGETFPYDVIVALGSTREELLAHIDKRFIGALTPDERDSLQCPGRGRTFRLQNNAYICWTKDFPHSPDTFAYLAHEIFHTADLILRKAGASLSDDSDEVWAYQIDWLTKRIYAAFKLV